MCPLRRALPDFQMVEPLSFDGYLAAVLTHAHDAILSVDNGGTIVSWNPAAERLFGYSQKQAVGRPLHAMVQPGWENDLQEMLAAVRSGEQVRRELVCLCADGSIAEVEMTLAPVRDYTREVGISAIVRDVTERKAAQRKLQQMHERLKLTQKAAGVGTWEWNIRTGELDWSDEVARLHGMPENQGYDFQSWFESIHPQDRRAVETALLRAVGEGADYDVEFRVVWPDGSAHWLAARGQVFPETADQPHRMLGIIMEVTERKQIEEARRRLGAIVESSADAIMGKDMRGAITSWNKGAQTVYGYSASEILGQDVSILMPPDRQDELPQIMARIAHGESIDHFETQRMTKDGRIIDVSLSVSPIEEEDGKIMGASTIARDITERKRAEDALRNSEKLAATGRLAASIAHEINNPLESVTNLLYLLEHHAALDSAARQYVSMAGEELARIVHITRQTLGFYREAAAPVSILISELLNNVLELYSRRIQSRRVRVERRFGTHPEIRGFPGEMRQVFSNLIINGLEAVGEAGQLKLHVFESRDWAQPERRGVRVVIADNGSGIPREHARRIFEPFYTTKGERGTGLGLWVSNGSCRSMVARFACVRGSAAEPSFLCSCRLKSSWQKPRSLDCLAPLVRSGVKRVTMSSRLRRFAALSVTITNILRQLSY